jgi:signal peptidase I
MCVGLALATTVGVLATTTDIYVVTSPSMEPALHCAGAAGCERLEPDSIVVERITYQFRSPRRGDMVLIEWKRQRPLCSERVLVKRIVGLPGDVIEYSTGVLVADGQRTGRLRAHRQSHLDAPTEAQRVPRAKFFVMGDNRSHSCDSREFGLVPREAIKGRVHRSPRALTRLVT